jgi:FkbH-like protein
MTDILTYIRLAQEYGQKRPRPKKKSPTSPEIQIAVVTNFTDDILVKVLTGLCVSEGIAPDIQAVPFKQYLFELKNPKSALARRQADITFIFFDVNPYQTSEFIADESHGSEVVKDISRFSKTRKGLVVLNTILPPSSAQHGQLFSGNDLDKLVAQYNEKIRLLAAERTNIYVVETGRLMQTIGENRARDFRGLYAFSQPFSNDFMLAVAKAWMRYIRTKAGKARKVIVVDLDNTLWGGIVGETGSQGIALGPEYPGNAFQEFQRILLRYYERGIILAINSRNNPEDVDEVFAKNPHMILTKNHFAAIAINWNTKAENLRTIAKELNVGLDSLVFFDDDPMNRDLVRTQLPEVLVPEFSVPPEEYPRLLLDLDVFNSLRLTDEDKERGQMYAVERKRKEIQASASSPEEYIARLGVEIDVSRNNRALLPRLAQLTQKTNQFNLTTYRSTEQELGEWIDDGAVAYAGDVRDKFGGYGVTIMAVVRPEKVSGKNKKGPKTAELAIFLMSCRIMGRQVEQRFFRTMLADLKKRGFTKLTARFIPSKKNMPAKDFLAGVGGKKKASTKAASEYEFTLLK